MRDTLTRLNAKSKTTTTRTRTIWLRLRRFVLFVSLWCNSIQRSDTHELNNLVGEGPRRFLGNVMATCFEHAAADVNGH
jgi:hypothetical protein